MCLLSKEADTMNWKPYELKLTNSSSNVSLLSMSSAYGCQQDEENKEQQLESPKPTARGSRWKTGVACENKVRLPRRQTSHDSLCKLNKDGDCTGPSLSRRSSDPVIPPRRKASKSNSDMQDILKALETDIRKEVLRNVYKDDQSSIRTLYHGQPPERKTPSPRKGFLLKAHLVENLASALAMLNENQDLLP